MFPPTTLFLLFFPTSLTPFFWLPITLLNMLNYFNNLFSGNASSSTNNATLNQAVVDLTSADTNNALSTPVIVDQQHPTPVSNLQSNVIALEDGENDFTEVQVRRLSYAEVARLSITAPTQSPNVVTNSKHIPIKIKTGSSKFIMFDDNGNDCDWKAGSVWEEDGDLVDRLDSVGAFTEVGRQTGPTPHSIALDMEIDKYLDMTPSNSKDLKILVRDKYPNKCCPRETRSKIDIFVN